MSHFLKSILSPMLSLFILILGNGYLMTLVPIRAQLEGFSPEIVGYLASAFFLGILIGAIKINKIIEGVGHIRAFAFFASIFSTLTLLQGIFVDPYAWIVFRFLIGLTMSGIFITIESWLLVKSSLKMRGMALSIYMTIFYAAQSIGQLFLGAFDSQSLYPFCFIVILATLSVLPLTITKTKAPIVEEESVLSLIKLFKLSPVALVAGLFAGFVLGPIYGLLPLYVQDLNFTEDQISWIMGAVIFGGLVFQWPIGAISDRIDRRIVLFACAISASVLVFFICLFPQVNFVNFLIFSIIFGGFAFVLYPLSVSHACDFVDAKDITATTGAVLVSYGLGSIIGPIGASYGMSIFGSVALFYFLFIVLIFLCVVLFFRVILKKSVPTEEKLPYSNMPRTSLIASELDPRSDNEEDKNK